MHRTFFQDFTADNGIPVTVEYGYEDHGLCVCIVEAWKTHGDNAIVVLTDVEDERMAAWIMEHRHWDDHDDSGDDD